MRIDLYTKSVLTVIAVCLLWIAFGRGEPVVSAQAGRQKVILVGWEDEFDHTHDLPLGSFGSAPIPVHLDK